MAAGTGSYRAQIANELFGSDASPLGIYFEVYDDLMARADVPVLQIEDPDTIGLTSIGHVDVLKGAELLRQNPGLTLDAATRELDIRLTGAHSTTQLRYAVFVAVRLMLMLDCSGSRRSCDTWLGNQTFSDFTRLCFPQTSNTNQRVAKAMAERKAMKAWKLKSKLGMSLIGTDNLARHLELDVNGPTLYIFHHTSFLRVQQSLSESESNDDWELNLSRGRLPPSLVTETLHSIKEILFPFGDDRSAGILNRLIERHGFDKDCIELGPAMLQETQRLEYTYWGERLAALYELTQNRPPRTRFEKWMRWQTSESNAFAVALAALCISIVVGILTLGLGGVQVYISWKAWKEPVDQGPQMTISVEELVAWIREHDR